MHNILSFNQLADWRQSVKHLEETISSVSDQSDAINDYYNCLIECDDDQSTKGSVRRYSIRCTQNFNCHRPLDRGLFLSYYKYINDDEMVTFLNPLDHTPNRDL